MTTNITKSESRSGKTLTAEQGLGKGSLGVAQDIQGYVDEMVELAEEKANYARVIGRLNGLKTMIDDLVASVEGERT